MIIADAPVPSQLHWRDRAELHHRQGRGDASGHRKQGVYWPAPDGYGAEFYAVRPSEFAFANAVCSRTIPPLTSQLRREPRVAARVLSATAPLPEFLARASVEPGRHPMGRNAVSLDHWTILRRTPRGHAIRSRHPPSQMYCEWTPLAQIRKKASGESPAPACTFSPQCHSRPPMPSHQCMHWSFEE